MNSTNANRTAKGAPTLSPVVAPVAFGSFLVLLGLIALILIAPIT